MKAAEVEQEKYEGVIYTLECGAVEIIYSPVFGKIAVDGKKVKKSVRGPSPSDSKWCSGIAVFEKGAWFAKTIVVDQTAHLMSKIMNGRRVFEGVALVCNVHTDIAWLWNDHIGKIIVEGESLLNGLQPLKSARFRACKSSAHPMAGFMATEVKLAESEEFETEILRFKKNMLLVEDGIAEMDGMRVLCADDRSINSPYFAADRFWRKDQRVSILYYRQFQCTQYDAVSLFITDNEETVTGINDGIFSVGGGSQSRTETSAASSAKSVRRSNDSRSHDTPWSGRLDLLSGVFLDLNLGERASSNEKPVSGDRPADSLTKSSCLNTSHSSSFAARGESFLSEHSSWNDDSPYVAYRNIENSETVEGGGVTCESDDDGSGGSSLDSSIDAKFYDEEYLRSLEKKACVSAQAAEIHNFSASQADGSTYGCVEVTDKSEICSYDGSANSCLTSGNVPKAERAQTSATVSTKNVLSSLPKSSFQVDASKSEVLKINTDKSAKGILSYMQNGQNLEKCGDDEGTIGGSEKSGSNYRDSSLNSSDLDSTFYDAEYLPSLEGKLCASPPLQDEELKADRIFHGALTLAGGDKDARDKKEAAVGSLVDEIVVNGKDLEVSIRTSPKEVHSEIDLPSSSTFTIDQHKQCVSEVIGENSCNRSAQVTETFESKEDIVSLSEDSESLYSSELDQNFYDESFIQGIVVETNERTSLSRQSLPKDTVNTNLLEDNEDVFGPFMSKGNSKKPKEDIPEDFSNTVHPEVVLLGEKLSEGNSFPGTLVDEQRGSAFISHTEDGDTGAHPEASSSDECEKTKEKETLKEELQRQRSDVLDLLLSQLKAYESDHKSFQEVKANTNMVTERNSSTSENAVLTENSPQKTSSKSNSLEVEGILDGNDEDAAEWFETILMNGALRSEIIRRSHLGGLLLAAMAAYLTGASSIPEYCRLLNSSNVGDDETDEESLCRATRRELHRLFGSTNLKNEK